MLKRCQTIAFLYASQIVPPSSKAKAVCIDLSKYDKLISEFLIQSGSSILRMLIEPDEPDSADKSVWDPIIDYRRRSSEDQGYYCYPFDMILLVGSKAKAMPIIRANQSDKVDTRTSYIYRYKYL